MKTLNEITEVRDERMVEMNNLLATKLSAVSKSKREGIKESKNLARLIIENWDNKEMLESLCEGTNVKEFYYRLYCIAKSRIDQLDAAAAAALEEFLKNEYPEEYKKEEKEVTAQEKPKLTEKDCRVLQVICNSIEEESSFQFEEVARNAKDLFGISEASLKGSFSSLQKKGMIVLNEGGCYFCSWVTEEGLKKFIELTQTKPEEKKEEVAKEEEKPVTKKNAGRAKVERKVGDIHKNGLWVWTEHKPGKFDWRIRPELKKKPGAKKAQGDKSPASSSKKTVETKKGKKEGEKVAEKALTVADFLKIARTATARSTTFTKAQKEALKLITKGYWISQNGSAYFFRNEKGETKSCNMESVVALFKKYGLNSLPVDLVK